MVDPPYLRVREWLEASLYNVHIIPVGSEKVVRKGYRFFDGIFQVCCGQNSLTAVDNGVDLLELSECIETYAARKSLLQLVECRMFIYRIQYAKGVRYTENFI